jgi:hypothetical protein
MATESAQTNKGLAASERLCSKDPTNKKAFWFFSPRNPRNPQLKMHLTPGC